MNGYELSRKWFDWAFENPELVTPNHTALYFYIIEHCNRLGWKRKFGLPTEITKSAIGIKSYHTYIKTLKDLIKWEFIDLIQKSENQHTSNIVALTYFDKPHDKPLDTAIKNQISEQSKSTCETNNSIDKPNNNKTKELKDQILTFDDFWAKYPNKKSKKTCRQKFERISANDRQKIKDTIDAFIKHKPFESYTHPNPLTYLNQERWEDEIPTKAIKSRFDIDEFRASVDYNPTNPYLKVHGN